jgi:predicted  nucleic acid-binding Zn-ribbon protein
MEQRLRTRLSELRAEFDSGTQRLRDLDSQVRALQQTLLRISGAIQVLEEELASGAKDDSSLADASHDPAEAGDASTRP